MYQALLSHDVIHVHLFPVEALMRASPLVLLLFLIVIFHATAPGALARSPFASVYLAGLLGVDKATGGEESSVTTSGFLWGAAGRAVFGHLGLGGTWARSHHGDNPDRDGEYFNYITTATGDVLLNFVTDRDFRVYLIGSYGKVWEYWEGDYEVGGTDYHFEEEYDYTIYGGGAGFFTRPREPGFAVGAEGRYLTVPDSRNHTGIIQVYGTAGFVF
jgi:hypothetical protein